VYGSLASGSNARTAHASGSRLACSRRLRKRHPAVYFALQAVVFPIGWLVGSAIVSAPLGTALVGAAVGAILSSWRALRSYRREIERRPEPPMHSGKLDGSGTQPGADQLDPQVRG
jgi:hypothetical protein